MSISNINPQSKDIVIYQRDDTNTYWGEAHISGSNLIFYIDAQGNINADISASFYTLFPPTDVSGGSGTTLITGGLYPITASWAISASWAPSAGGSGTTLVTGGLYPITSSWAVNVINAIFSTIASSSLFASSSVSSSIINILSTASNANFYVPFVISNSYQSVYIDPNSIYYNPGTDVLTVNNISASSITASLLGTASLALNSFTASWITASNVSGIIATASFALNFNPSATASYASNAKSASYSVLSDTASLATSIYNPFFVQVFS